MKKLPKDIKKKLDIVWQKRKKLRDKSRKLVIKVKQLHPKGNEIQASTFDILVKANTLWIRGEQLWVKALLKHCGNIRLTWKPISGEDECHLESGDIFKI